MPLVRFLSPDDERLVSTVEAIAEELVVDGLVLRMRPDDPNFAVEGETFTVCSFWLVCSELLFFKFQCAVLGVDLHGLAFANFAFEDAD